MTAAQKLQWFRQEKPDAFGNAESVGERNGNIYNITGEGDDWMVTHTVTTVIARHVGGKAAWRAAVDHHNEHYQAADPARWTTQMLMGQPKANWVR